MQMNKERWIAVALILLIIGGVVYLRGRNKAKISEQQEVGEGVEIEDKASEFAKMLGVTLPDDVEKISLNDVTGGASTGIATRKAEANKFVHSVLAALPDPEKGYWYEGWLVREDPFAVMYTGRLTMAKGGWVLDYTSGQNLSDYPKVVVTKEKVNDQRPEAHVLEGSF